MWNGVGFVPIGSSSGGGFSGTFNGQGNTLSNLFIGRYNGFTNLFLSNVDVGLFQGIATGGVVKNISVTDATVQGYHISAIGILAGTNNGSIINSSVSGKQYPGGSAVIGELATGSGGLVGYNSGTITGSSANVSMWTASVTGTGGLVGYNNGTIDQSSATGSLYGGYYVGALAGVNGGTGVISYSHADTDFVWGGVFQYKLPLTAKLCGPKSPHSTRYRKALARFSFSIASRVRCAESVL